MNAIEAASKAIEHAKALYPAALADSFLLEEVECTEGEAGALWKITLSFYVPRQRPRSVLESGATAAMQAALGAGLEKTFKQFIVRDSDGKVLSMRIRELSALPS